MLSINTLSDIIMDNMVSCASEERYPQRTADEMDDFIKDKREKVQKLREIRSELEYVFTGMLK